MKRIFKLLFCIIPVLLISGCTKKVTKEIKPTKMEQFIVQKTEDDKIVNYTFKNDKYEKITDNNVKNKYLLYYNEKYNAAQYNDGGNIVINKDDKTVKMPDSTEFVKINNDCSKVFYKLAEGDSYSYNIIDINDNKKISIDITLSGNCIDWKDRSTLVFYGIVNNEAGLYYYDVNSKIIDNAAKIDNGFVSYVKVIGSNIYYLVNSYNGSSHLLGLSNNSSQSFNIDVTYKNIFDVKNIDETVFVMAGNSEKVDLYYVSDGEITRINYDFPKTIKIDSFLYKKHKYIYFIGLDENDNEGIYSYSASDNEIQLKCSVEGKNHIAIND